MEVTTHTNGCSEGEGRLPGKSPDLCPRDERPVNNQVERIWAVGMRIRCRQRMSVGLERSE